MPTIIYKLADNTRVPSVTTINKIGQDPGGLIHWAWNLGMNNMDYRQARDEAAEAGTIGHALVDAALHGTELDMSKIAADVTDKAENAFLAYLEWREQTKLNIIASEVPLVSEAHRFGGCLDAVAKVKSEYHLCDWKTGSLYPDHLCQVAAYGALWNEHEPERKITGYHLCRFNKENGDFAHAYFSDLSDAWEAFKLKRQLYDLLAKLKKRV
jgi:hypothetical protein